MGINRGPERPSSRPPPAPAMVREATLDFSNSLAGGKQMREAGGFQGGGEIEGRTGIWGA